MPGNIKRITGANPKPLVTKKYMYYNNVSGDVHNMPKDIVKNITKFNHQQEVDRMKFFSKNVKPLLPIWEDRNRANQNTKLNY